MGEQLFVTATDSFVIPQPHCLLRRRLRAVQMWVVWLRASCVSSRQLPINGRSDFSEMCAVGYFALV